MAKKNEKIEPNEFCVLQPTSPLRIPRDIDGAINLFKKKKADVVLSVYKKKPLLWHFRLSNKNKMIAIEKSNKRMLPRQKHSNMFLQNGSVHVFRLSALKKNKSYYLKNTYGYQMPPIRSIDIDTLADFNLAEQIMKVNKYKDA